METNSLNKKSIDWKAFRSEVHKHGKNDKTIEDAHKTIQFALLQLHDNHSSLLSKSEIKTIVDTLKRNPIVISNIDNGVAYLKIPPYIGNDSLQLSFAKGLQSLIEKFDKSDPKGWIIDLTQNIGGNMWPMLLGLGPLIGDGISGYFVDADKNFTKWGYTNGQVFSGEKTILRLDNPYQLKNKDKRIAILVGKGTVSSAEIIAIAFKGIPNTLFFGQDTPGLTTGNSNFRLRDGSIILLTTSRVADRNKREYGKPLSASVYDDKPIDAALHWLNGK